MFRKEEENPTPKLNGDTLSIIVGLSDVETKEVLAQTTKELQKQVKNSDIVIEVPYLDNQNNISGSTAYSLNYREGINHYKAVQELKNNANYGFIPEKDKDIPLVAGLSPAIKILGWSLNITLGLGTLFYLSDVQLDPKHAALLGLLVLGGGCVYAGLRLFNTAQNTQQAVHNFETQESLHQSLSGLSKKRS